MILAEDMQTVIDVWGGWHDMDHLARFIRPWNAEAVSLVSKELANGFLVNVRREISWGEDKDFDARAEGAKGNN